MFNSIDIALRRLEDKYRRKHYAWQSGIHHAFNNFLSSFMALSVTEIPEVTDD